MMGVAALPGIMVAPGRRGALLDTPQPPRLCGDRNIVLGNSCGLTVKVGLDRGVGEASNLGVWSAAFSNVT